MYLTLKPEAVDCRVGTISQRVYFIDLVNNTVTITHGRVSRTPPRRCADLPLSPHVSTREW